MMGSPREQLVERFKAALDPAEWDVLPFAREATGIRRPTVMVTAQRIEQGPGGAGVWACTMRVDVLSPLEDWDRAEAQLEDGVVAILNALEPLGNINLGADRVVIGEDPAQGRQAWRVQTTLPLVTDPEPDPTTET